MKTFRSYDQDQMLLMPPSVSDWVNDDHVSRMISEIVDHQLDMLGGINIIRSQSSDREEVGPISMRTVGPE